MAEATAETLNELKEEVEEVKSAADAKSDSEIETAYAGISFRVIYQAHNYLLPQLKDLIDNGDVLNLRPEYQRRLRWDNKKKSLLIESLFLNIPIPPIFLYESEAARYEVMDGQQRLNAIHTYLANDFRLTGLEKLSFLNGRSYLRLPPKLKRALDRASVSAIVLLQETKADSNDPYLVRRYVFERLNTGGQKLNPQEVRNSIYRGEFNNLIVSLARHPDFCNAFSIPPYTETDENEYYENPERQKNSLYKTMSDCQIVLRFFAFQDHEKIVGSVNAMLDRTMARYKVVTPEELQNLGDVFIQTLSTVRSIFGDFPFVLGTGDGNDRISISMYDAMMGAVFRRRVSADALAERAEEVRIKVAALKGNQRQLLTGKANTAQGIKDRIDAIVAILDEESHAGAAG
jgi:hypothetical protein